MGWKNDRLDYLEQQLRDMQALASNQQSELSEQRSEIHALKAGVETTWEVITITSSGTRNSRGFSEIVDALHHAAYLRIEANYGRVTINKIETRRQALYPNGNAIAPFGR